MPRTPRSVDLTQVSEWDDGYLRRKDDYLAAEEPLEIRIGADPLSVTMRTPGHDRELAAGFLFTEGLIQRREQILKLEIAEPQDGTNRGNVIEAELAPEAAPDFAKMKRHFFAASSCGICGKASIDSIRSRLLAAPNPDFRLDAELLITPAGRTAPFARRVPTHRRPARRRPVRPARENCSSCAKISAVTTRWIK